MKFAFDVDGVITEAPGFFSEISKALRKSGHEIHIVSDYDESFKSQRVRDSLNMALNTITLKLLLIRPHIAKWYYLGGG